MHRIESVKPRVLNPIQSVEPLECRTQGAKSQVPSPAGSRCSCCQLPICRRGAKEADGLILELVRIADAVRGDTNKHMAHEEQEVLPLLEAHLCAAEQRAMVWRTLRAMPLRLLERVMPWVAGHIPSLLTPSYILIAT